MFHVLALAVCLTCFTCTLSPAPTNTWNALEESDDASDSASGFPRTNIWNTLEESDDASESGPGSKARPKGRPKQDACYAKPNCKQKRAASGALGGGGALASDHASVGHLRPSGDSVVELAYLQHLRPLGDSVCVS